MTEQELRYEVIKAKGHGNGELHIGYDYLQRISFFQKSEEVASMESVMLTLNGHAPIRTRNYDYSEVVKWCEKMNFRCAQVEGRDVVIMAR